MFFTWGNAAFLASVRHFCRVSRDVFFVSCLIPYRAYFVSCLIPSEIADFAGGKNRRSGDCCGRFLSFRIHGGLSRARLILPAGEMAKMSYYKKERGSSEPWRLSDKSAA